MHPMIVGDLIRLAATLLDRSTTLKTITVLP
jgi:hypothetical protein